MDRRDFLKLAGLAGLSLVTPLGALTGKARAQAGGDYDGPLWVLVNAAGGWDPTSLCDPKGARTEEDPDRLNNFLADDIGESGRLRWAPVSNNEYFFEKYYRELLVVNGIDTETNGHDSGTRHTWSGRLSEGHPSFAALLASSVAREKPMSFLSNGGYEFTAGLIGPSRVGDVNTLVQIAYPNRAWAGDPDSSIHSEPTWDRIVAAQRARLEGLQARQTLPRLQRSTSLLYSARMGDNELQRLSDFLPETLDNSGNRLRRQAQIAIAAYRAGLSVAVNLETGGFDTHGNHEANHYPRLADLLDGVDFLMDEAERQGVRDRVVVAIGSDFGRTPGYNDNNGKDHWSITSMMFMGAGIRGNRTVGQTDEGHRPIGINPRTLEAAPSTDYRITPEHVHRAMRRLAGIHETEGARMFPLGGEDIDLFG